MSALWLHVGQDGAASLTLQVQPGAGRTEVAGVHGDALKLRLAAPPVDGKANDCLVAFLSRRLGIPRSQVQIVAGAASRRKRVRVTGASTRALEDLAG